MGERPIAAILSVGTELTEGSVLNTHFRFLGAELRGLGFFTRKAVQIPDDAGLFSRELREAIASSGLVIITGGLGPTSDDLTREVVADVCDAPLRFEPGIWDDLVARYAGGGRKIASSNRKQAMIPSGFEILPNGVGSAPGFWGEKDTCLVIALPGPPAELERMFQQSVAPVVRQRFRGPQYSAASELVATAFMIPESLLEEALQELKPADCEVLWSTRVAHDRIAFTLRRSTEADRRRIFEGLTRRFGTVRIRSGDVQPSGELLRILKDRRQTAALAESCTGGLVSKQLTDIPGSSEVFWGAFVTYSNESKQSLLGVPGRVLEKFGAVSEEVASAMSDGLLKRTPADLAMAVTGIAGPEGGSPQKPVGTVWICARHRPGGRLCRRFHFRGNRDAVRRRAAVAAFVIAECVLLGVDAELEY
jgi:nicotinamide-nucleotide amidase